MAAREALGLGRDAFRRRAWGDAHNQLSTADQEASLDVEDLERLAMAAHLLGRDDDSANLWTRAHHACLRRGDAPRAARCAFWLAFELLHRGEAARGGGWVARAQRLLDEARLDCVEQGYLRFPSAMGRAFAGEWATAYARFDESTAIGDRFVDADLVTLGRQGQGRALIIWARPPRAWRCSTRPWSPSRPAKCRRSWLAIVYCSVIEACQEIFDLRRAQQWTAALEPLVCVAAGPGAVPRSVPGAPGRDHAAARRLAGRAGRSAAGRAIGCPNPPASRRSGAAFYQQAELHRLRGEFSRPRTRTARPTEGGRTPQPGLALLRLAQGQVDAAAMAHPRACSTKPRTVSPASKVLAAFAEIMLAAGRRSGGPRRRRRAHRDRRRPRCAAACVRGGPRRRGRPARRRRRRAPHSPSLRRAWTAWRELEAPYEAARVRVLIGLACRALGDDDTARDGVGRRALRLPAAWRDARAGPPEAARRHAAPKSAGRIDRSRGRRCSASSPRARPTARSPPSCSSASTPSPGMCRTSSPSSTCRRGPRPAPSRIEHELV